MNASPAKTASPAVAPSPNAWLGKALAGSLLGLPLALGLSGLVGWLTPGALAPFNAKHQLLMWSIGLFWMLILAGCFLFRDGRRAWLWLGAATLGCHALFFGARALGLGQ